MVPTYNGLGEEKKVMPNLTFSKQVHLSVSKCFVFFGGGVQFLHKLKMSKSLIPNKVFSFPFLKKAKALGIVFVELKPVY